MILDLIIGILASLIASVLVGLCGNKVIAKQSSIVLKVYVLFLAAVAFVVAAILSIVLNKNFAEIISSISEANLLRFYSNCINGFILILVIVGGVSGIVIVSEVMDRSSRRDHKQDMERYKTLR